MSAASDRPGQPARPRPGDLRAARAARRASAPTPRPTATSTSGSSCCTRAATSRSRRSGSRVADRLRGRPVDVLQAAARGPRAALRRRHPRDAALPAAARADRRAARRGPDDDRRGRLLVPARHRGDELPHASTSRRSIVAEAIDLDARAPALLPQRRATTSSSGEDYRGVFRLGRAFSADVLPPYTELVRFDAGPAAARRRSCATRPRELLRRHLARRPATNPFARFGARARARPAARCSTGDAAALPRLRVRDGAHGRRRLRARARRTSTGCSATTGAGRVGRARPDRRGLARRSRFKLARRRRVRPEPGDRRAGRRPGTRRSTALDAVVG